jgi:hypothetical protein
LFQPLDQIQWGGASGLALTRASALALTQPVVVYLLCGHFWPNSPSVREGKCQNPRAAHPIGDEFRAGSQGVKGRRAKRALEALRGRVVRQSPTGWVDLGHRAGIALAGPVGPSPKILPSIRRLNFTPCALHSQWAPTSGMARVTVTALSRVRLDRGTCRSYAASALTKRTNSLDAGGIQPRTVDVALRRGLDHGGKPGDRLVSVHRSAPLERRSQAVRSHRSRLSRTLPRTTDTVLPTQLNVSLIFLLRSFSGTR